ncbi:uncharacterized protein LOC131281161 [Anopheles ziemanni]|uniref:uncharacterized protein LOC131263563 n=1 Tax=Anopheles coustani TaxID=139045 RepID=UPI00265A887E|nr:uncharacterized protein LOC131263563 [Anopheles coustani]XP_058166403.1 uncharacterized protein LOC131281161 [Anopheles ziemanni]
MADKTVQRNSLLNGNEMVQHHTSTYEVHSQFNRLVSLDELDESRQHDLKRMQEELRLLLTQERVNKSGSISEGAWEEDQHRVRLTRVEGKWQSYGYENSTGKYVESHEALFLMEMNRLMVKWKGVVVSIEQGYSLLLGRPNSLTLEEYQVYSVLNRASYYVLQYDPVRVYRTEVTDLPSVEERCVWGNLYEMLHQPNPRETLDPKANGKLYETVRRSMLKYNNLIKKQSSVKDQTSGEEFNKEVKEPATKRSKFEFQEVCRENECFSMVERFRRIFDRFDIIRSISEHHHNDGDASLQDEHRCDSVEDPGTLQIAFDLFAPEWQGFKKSHLPLPIARIVVRRSSQSMPYFRELLAIHNRQNQRVPLMLMLVSDSLTVHCFLYDMTRVPRNIITLPNESTSGTK